MNCHHCGGSGRSHDGYRPVQCPRCNGTGLEAGKPYPGRRVRIWWLVVAFVVGWLFWWVASGVVTSARALEREHKAGRYGR